MMHVAVVGGGIMGQLMAFFATQEGWKVTLCNDDENNCSQVAAGLLSPIAELEKNDILIAKMGFDSLTQHWPKILSALHEPVYFKNSGSLIVAHPRDAAALYHYINIISKKLGHHDFYQTLNQETITHLEPDIAQFKEGFYFHQEGCLDNQKLLKTLKNHLIQVGVRWIPETVHEPETLDSDFDWVFDCRGLKAKTQFSDLRGVRGELILVETNEVKISRPIQFLHPRYRLYLVPKPNNRYVIGASEIESEDDSPMSVRTTLELLTALYSINPNFAEARIIHSMTHCRPTFSNHLPKIQKKKNIVAINGLYRHGFLIAPSLATEVIHHIKNGSSSVQYPQIWETFL